jgi:hypothetical protein
LRTSALVHPALLGGMHMQDRISHTHHWFMAAERAAMRSLVVIAGVMLIVVSLLLDASIMLLPAGIALGIAGGGLIVWGVTGDLVNDR